MQRFCVVVVAMFGWRWDSAQAVVGEPAPNAFLQMKDPRCPVGTHVESRVMCSDASKKVGIGKEAQLLPNGAQPYGCYYKSITKQVYWNPTGDKDMDDKDRLSLCQTQGPSKIVAVSRWAKGVSQIHVQKNAKTAIKLDASFTLPNNMEDEVTVIVPDAFTVGEVAVTLSKLRHERAGDLQIKLVSPDGLAVVLMAPKGSCPLGNGVVSKLRADLYSTVLGDVETLGDQSTHPSNGVDYVFSTSAAEEFPDCEDLAKLLKQAKATGLPLPQGFNPQAWHAKHAIPGGTYRTSNKSLALGLYEGRKTPKDGTWRIIFTDKSIKDIGYFNDACIRFVDSRGGNHGPYCMETSTTIIQTSFATVPADSTSKYPICANTPPCITADYTLNNQLRVMDPVRRMFYPWRTFNFHTMPSDGAFNLVYEVRVNKMIGDSSSQQTTIVVTDIGCTDPTAFNYQPTATWPAHSADKSFCNYSSTHCVVNDAHNNVPLRIPVSSPSSRTASYTIDHSDGAMIAARLRDQWLQSDCDGKFGTYNDPIGAPCTHRFYRDTWQLTVRKLDAHHTQVVVSRVDGSTLMEDKGWSYDGLQIEYTVCGQSAASGVRQGLWRPTEQTLDSSNSVLPNSKCSFVRTRDCDPDGPIEDGLALRCGAVIREGWSGYCKCADRKTYKKGCENHPPFTCKDACAVPDSWLCDPTWYDNGMCDVACGAADPDCSRDTLVPWARLAEPMYLGQGMRRGRDTRGWS